MPESNRLSPRKSSRKRNINYIEDKESKETDFRKKTKINKRKKEKIYQTAKSLTHLKQ